MLALLTTTIDIARVGYADVFVSYVRTLIMVLLVARQVLTLRENRYLTAHLEQRVSERTTELAASRERFEALVQHSSDLVTVVDADARVQYQSASSLGILGLAPDEVEGMWLCDLMTPVGAATFTAALTQVDARAAGRPHRGRRLPARRRRHPRRGADDHQPARHPARPGLRAQQP